MIQPPPPKPDGSDAESRWYQWATESILQLRHVDVQGEPVLRTSRGVALFGQGPSVSRVVNGPLDQAVFVPAVGDRAAFIGAVRGGYVFKFNTGGGYASSARYAAPSVGLSSLCYDSVNDKLICSYWNDGRANDSGVIEPNDQKGLFKINPDTLATELFVALSGEGPPFMATDMWDGARDLQFYNGKIYGVYFGSQPGFSTDGQVMLFEADPVTLGMTRHKITAGMTGGDGPSSPWVCTAIDAAGGRLWQTSPGDTALCSVDLATFATFHEYFTSNTIFTPTGIDLGTLAPGIDGAVYNWSGGPFASGAYIISYLGGAIHVSTAPEKWTLNLGTPNIPAIEFDPAINGVYNRFNAVPLAVGLFDSSAACEAASAGNFKFIYGGGQIGLAVNFFDESGHNLGPGSVYSYDPQPSFNLYQVGTYSTAGVNYPPYGLCVVPDFNKIIVTGRSRFMQVFDLGSLTFEAAPFDLGDTTTNPDWDSGTAYTPGMVVRFASSSWRSILAGTGQQPDASPTYWTFVDPHLPYRVRYNPDDKLLYIPTLKSNEVITMDPDTGAVVHAFDGFDSPFDVVFVPKTDTSPGAAFAVQQGLVGLRQIS